jgi:hypothetical protein
MSKQKSLEVWGILIIFLLFSGLHFLYSGTGLEIFKPFSAINESVWEHLKIGFFAALFYAIFEYFMGFKDNSNFIFGKSIALLSIPIFIAIVFYSYTAILGRSVLWVDILTAFISVVISQWISYKIAFSSKGFSRFTPLGNILIIVMVFSFIFFTYFPPDFGIFIEKKQI